MKKNNFDIDNYVTEESYNSDNEIYSNYNLSSFKI